MLFMCFKCICWTAWFSKIDLLDRTELICSNHEMRNDLIEQVFYEKLSLVPLLEPI